MLKAWWPPLPFFGAYHCVHLHDRSPLGPFAACRCLADRQHLLLAGIWLSFCHPWRSHHREMRLLGPSWCSAISCRCICMSAIVGLFPFTYTKSLHETVLLWMQHTSLHHCCRRLTRNLLHRCDDCACGNRGAPLQYVPL